MDKDKLWKDTLNLLKLSVSSATYGTYLVHSHIHDLKEVGGRVVIEIGCMSFYIKAQVEQRYFGLIQDTLSKILEKPVDITFIVKQSTVNSQQSIEKPTPLFDEPKVNKQEIDEAIKNARIRPSYTFDKFAVSGSNQLAHAAAEAVSKNLGHAYNPLFIWGGVGVGKSHLMHAIGHVVVSKNPRAKIIACTAEDFTNDIVDGIRNKTTAEVRKKYRKLEALFIDDIQFIAGKDTAQEEFFHTFNAVTTAGGQVVLTSDKPPSEISKLELRLRSRFEAGLIVDVAPPDFELRSAIVQIKAEERGLKLDPDMVSLIAGNIESARAIEGFLVRLFTDINLKGGELTIDNIQKIIGKNNGLEESKIKASPEEIVKTIAKYYSINKRDLLGESRARIYSRPRQILMYILRTQINLPYQTVGRIVGGKDHTTVMHAVDNIQLLASTNVDIQGDLSGIKKMLLG
jgi:chromosomal replication initiator protein